MVHDMDNSNGKCPRCGKNSLIVVGETNETCCNNCGFVIDEKVIESDSYWQAIASNNDNNKARAGAPTSLAVHDKGLSTNISSGYTDATGKSLSSDMKYTMKRLKIWDSRTKNSAVDRNLIGAFNEMRRLADKLSLSRVTVEEAAYIYRKAVDAKLVRGRSIIAIVTASIYVACRNTDTTRNLKDLENASNIKRKDIARCYRLLLKSLDLKTKVVDPISCIARIGSVIKVKESTIRIAIKILNEARRSDGIAGKDPMGLAAASLYLACINNNEDATQRVIAVAAGVTEVTIRNRFKGLKDLKLFEDKTIKITNKVK